MFEYYSVVLDLRCRVDPNIGKVVKLGHLWRGIKSTKLEKLRSLKLGTCDEFFQEGKLYQERTSRAGQGMRVLRKEDPEPHSTVGQGASVSAGGGTRRYYYSSIPTGGGYSTRVLHTIVTLCGIDKMKLGKKNRSLVLVTENVSFFIRKKFNLIGNLQEKYFTYVNNLY